MKKVALNICLVLAIALLSNCSVDKRHYRSGYQVSWNKSTTKRNDQPNIKSKSFDSTLSNQLSPLENTEILYASTQRIITKPGKRSGYAIKLPYDSCGDVITMLNGKEINAKVIEVNQRTVKYKSCENLGGPLFVESRENFFMIRYANGTKEIFTKATGKPDATKSGNTIAKTKGVGGDGSVKKVNPMALASLICVGAFFLYFPLVLAPIFAVIACVQFDKHPDKYKAKGMVAPGLIVGAIIITVLIVLLAGVI